MPAPALRIPISATVEAFERDMEKAKSATERAAKFMAERWARSNSELVKLGEQGVRSYVGALAQSTGATTAFVRSLAPLTTTGLALGGLLAIIGVFKVLSAIVDLAKSKMDEYLDIQTRAAAAGQGVEAWQRQVEAAKTFGLTVDNLSDAFKNFKRVSEDALGGSQLANRLKELRDAGNFQGNRGVQLFQRAGNQEERFRAMTVLITEAIQKGERLAALDLAERFLPPEMLDRLRASGDFLAEMERRAAAVAALDIISEADINQAADLKFRLEEAHKVLAERFKPIQQDLISLGLNYHENWVAVIERLAQAVGLAQQFYNWLKEIPDILAQAGNASWIKRLGKWMEDAGLTSTPESMGVTMVRPGMARVNEPEGGRSHEMVEARERLATMMKNRQARLEAERRTTEEGMRAPPRRDVSKVPGGAAKKGAAEEADAFDRAVEALDRHATAMAADAAAVGLNMAQQQQLRAEMRLLEAARQSGVEITDQQIETFARLRQEMTAEQALAAAGITLNDQQAESFRRVSDRIKKVATDLQSKRAMFEELMSASRDFGSAMSEAFKGLVLEGKKLDEVIRNLLNRLASRAIDRLFDMFFGAPAGGGYAPFLKLLGFGGARAEGGPVTAGRTYMVGEDGPELFTPRQTGRIIPNVQPIGQVNRRWAAPTITYAPVTSIDARGSELGEQRVRQIFAEYQGSTLQAVHRAFPQRLIRYQRLRS